MSDSARAGSPRAVPPRLALLAALAVSLLSACSATVQPIPSTEALVGYRSSSHDDLVGLPAPRQPIIVAVYKFRDQTGQYKPGTGTTGWSTAVTQGATSMLIKALHDAGGGQWFRVLERESLTDLLNERKIIRQTRKQYAESGAEGNRPALPPLLFAPILFDGGIIAYEANLLTGGAGARYFGLGGSTQYRRDAVTVYLRAVSVKNGEVLKSVLTSKTIFSVEVDVGLFRFVSFKRLAEVEAGFSTNEPPQMAVLESIERAIYAMVLEGAMQGIWSFEDAAAGQAAIERYLEEKRLRTPPAFDQATPLPAPPPTTAQSS